MIAVGKTAFYAVRRLVLLLSESELSTGQKDTFSYALDFLTFGQLPAEFVSIQYLSAIYCTSEKLRPKIIIVLFLTQDTATISDVTLTIT